MADNPDEADLENRTDFQSGNPTGETTPNQATEIIDPIHETENMEVHHHSHSSHEKKNWKSYAWEFLMLFLAVFCGFLAEYFLEHRIEKEKGKQYVQSMIEDMKSDSAKIEKALLRIEKQKLGLDSLSLIFSNPPDSDSIIKRMYFLMIKNTLNTYSISFTKRTIAQLRNSGGMRLIPNKTSADEITSYSELVDDIETQGKYYNDEMNEIVKLNQKIFDLKYIRGINQANTDSFITKPQILKLSNKENNLFREYSNLTYFTSGVLTLYSSQLTDLQAQISKSFVVLKKDNDIK
jgi:hypothetical protein